ncbi:MAG TPA: N-acetyltransferase [Bacteroidetes bacterium]|nr:N-acetyltransferase [Bacteroidota bacterium]
MNEQTKTPPYRIETDRLVIRCWNPEDVWKMETAVTSSLESLRPWMPWIKFEPKTIEERINLIRGFRANFDQDEDYIFGVFNKDESRMIGGTGLHTRQGPLTFEIGYWTITELQGQGYATEVAKIMTQIGLGYCGKERIEIRVEPENKGSWAIPQKLGFTHEVTRRRLMEAAVEGGDLCDIMIWTLLQGEYQEWDHRNLSLEAFDAAGQQLI